MLNNERFEIVKMKKILLNPPYFHHLYRFRSLSKILPSLYRTILKLENTWANKWFGKDFAVIARKKKETS